MTSSYHLSVLYYPCTIYYTQKEIEITMPLRKVRIQITTNGLFEAKVSSVLPTEFPLSFEIVTENEQVLIPDVLAVRLSEEGIICMFHTCNDEFYPVQFSYERKNNIPSVFKDAFYEVKSQLIRQPVRVNSL